MVILRKVDSNFFLQSLSNSGQVRILTKGILLRKSTLVNHISAAYVEVIILNLYKLFSLYNMIMQQLCLTITVSYDVIFLTTFRLKLSGKGHKPYAKFSFI